MTRSLQEVASVLFLADEGISQLEIARRTGIPRATLRDWLRRPREAVQSRAFREHYGEDCAMRSSAPEAQYAYLLGMYLGDGHITRHPRGVFRLRVFCDSRYRDIIRDCSDAMQAVVRRRVGILKTRHQCMVVYSHSKHWPCLFPQHGPGRKHERSIVLDEWQRGIVERFPEALLRGLIHSDGCRVLNKVKGGAYPRYMFSNRSDDIRAIFCDACNRLAIRWRRMNRYTISVARRPDVASLDRFVGPKS